VWQRQAIRQGGRFIKHVVPHVIKPIHSLWNQVIGFFFLCFAGWCGIGAYHYYRIYVTDPPAEKVNDVARIAGSLIVALIMASFGVSAFLKARRISRS
jgi:hypothetical protein